MQPNLSFEQGAGLNLTSPEKVGTRTQGSVHAHISSVMPFSAASWTEIRVFRPANQEERPIPQIILRYKFVSLVEFHRRFLSCCEGEQLGRLGNVVLHHPCGDSESPLCDP